MAEIVVHKLYEEKERQYIIDAYENFGKKTAFKLVYYYDESLDVVHIVDIWDMRQNPKKALCLKIQVILYIFKKRKKYGGKEISYR